MEKYYLESHEWVMALDDNTAVVGISDYAQHALGDIVFLSNAEVGDTVKLGDRFGDVESVKAVSEILSPLDGKVIEVNKELDDQPEILNTKPLETWIIKVEGKIDTSRLLTEADYLALDKGH